MKVVIIGAGIGGLATARGLLAAGHDVEVYEQAAELRTGGTGLILWSNGTGIVHDLGVSLAGLGCVLENVETRFDDGTRLWGVDLTRIADRFGQPNVVIPRGDLVTRLAESLPAGVIRLGMRCSGIEEPGDGAPVIARFGDGSAVQADLLIGADGLKSVVRRHLVGEEQPRYTGFATWHGLNPIDIDLAGSATGLTVYGKAGFSVLLPAGDGQVQWVFETPWQDGQQVPPGAREANEPVPHGPQPAGTILANLRARFGHWASPIPEVLEQVTDADVALFPHVLQRVPAAWGRGSITMVGDAVHAVPPALAQGVNQVLEDVWVLVRTLTAGPVEDVPPALRTYEDACRKRMRRLSRYASVMTKGAVPPRFLRRAGIPTTRVHGATIRMLSNRLREPGASGRETLSV